MRARCEGGERPQSKTHYASFYLAARPVEPFTAPFQGEEGPGGGTPEQPEGVHDAV